MSADWLEVLGAEAEAGDRERYVREHGGGLPPDAQEQIHAAVLRSLYADLPRAVRLAEAGSWLAAARRDGMALAARSRGHVAYLRGEYAAASEHYRTAGEGFLAAGLEVEWARTLSSGMQALIYQGRYADAEEGAAKAEKVFARHGDLLRLARLDTNVGNLHFRQDKAREALARYLRALEGFTQCGEPRDLAAAYANLAVCSTSLGRFADALRYYEQAREQAAAHGFGGLVARADYNIAYLHYLRGDYAEARRLYDATRVECAQSGDGYHAALCDLDEAELFLELNLTAEGEQMARRAAAQFARLGMPYEQGKAMVSVGIGANQRGNGAEADRALRAARQLFTGEGNRVWAALVDQLRAVLAFHEQRYGQAQRLSASARRVLAEATIPGRAAQSQLLLARLWLQAGFADRARALSREALERAGAECPPPVRFHAALVEGEIHERQGRRGEALASYEAARRELEDMRGRLDTEDLRISILTDKLAVYEALVSLRLDGPGEAAEAFACVQQAKSRTLADRLAMAWRPNGNEPAQVEGLRKELHWLYRQIDLAALLDLASGGGDRVGALREQLRRAEAELTEATRVLASPVTVQPEAGRLEDVLAVLGEDEAVLEYYEAREVLYLFVLRRTGLRTLRLGSCAPIRQVMKLLQFQLRKPRFPGEGRPEAALQHLRDLYGMLIRPAEECLAGLTHLIVAPYKNLHRVPFAALHDGVAALVDRFRMSGAPSASVFARCRQGRAAKAGRPVVIAVADERAPHIAEEGAEVAGLLGGARLIAGAEATLAALRDHGTGVPILHMAAHGVFRRDNPLFSSIQLADGGLHLMDLNRMHLDVDLLTLSACNTGSSVPVGGDELQGLIRGCLAAGARSVLVTLWELDDRCAREFMRGFYRRVMEGEDLAGAAGAAMRELRSRYPHPYYWAPFQVVGDSAAVRIAK